MSLICAVKSMFSSKFYSPLKVVSYKRIQVLSPYANRFLSAKLNKIERILCSTVFFMISSFLFKRKLGLSTDLGKCCNCFSLCLSRAVWVYSFFIKIWFCLFNYNVSLFLCLGSESFYLRLYPCFPSIKCLNIVNIWSFPLVSSSVSHTQSDSSVTGLICWKGKQYLWQSL